MSMVFLFTDKVILHYTLILVASGCRKNFEASARRLLTHCLPAGTRIQLMARNLANSLVTQYVTLAVTRSENQHHLIEPTFRGPLSLADLIVLVHRLGLGQAAGFVAVVDPWKYPDEATTVVPVIKSYIQGAVDKATHAGRSFHCWTEESKTEYLLSPLLSRNRPCLVRIPKTARAKSGSTSVMPVLPVSPPTALAMPGLTPAPTEPAIVQLLAPVLAEGPPPPPCLIHEPTTSRCF